MGRYTARRLLQFIPVLLGTMFLLHYMQALSFQINGNPIRALFGDRQPPPETLAAITRAFGLDDPCLSRPGNPCLGHVRRPAAATTPRRLRAVDFNRQPTSLDLIADARPDHHPAHPPRGPLRVGHRHHRRRPRRPPQGRLADNLVRVSPRC